jgi:hypothetical protein
MAWHPHQNGIRLTAPVQLGVDSADRRMRKGAHESPYAATSRISSLPRTGTVDSADRNVDSADQCNRTSTTYGSYPVDSAGQSNRESSNIFK